MIWEYAIGPRLLSIGRLSYPGPCPRSSCQHSGNLAAFDLDDRCHHQERWIHQLSFACAEARDFIRKRYSVLSISYGDRDTYGQNDSFCQSGSLTVFSLHVDVQSDFVYAGSSLDGLTVFTARHPLIVHALRRLVLYPSSPIMVTRILEALHTSFRSLRELVIGIPVHPGIDSFGLCDNVEWGKIFAEGLERWLMKLKMEKLPQWKIPVVRMVRYESEILDPGLQLNGPNDDRHLMICNHIFPWLADLIGTHNIWQD